MHLTLFLYPEGMEKVGRQYVEHLLIIVMPTVGNLTPGSVGWERFKFGAINDSYIPAVADFEQYFA